MAPASSTYRPMVNVKRKHEEREGGERTESPEAEGSAAHMQIHSCLGLSQGNPISANPSQQLLHFLSQEHWDSMSDLDNVPSTTQTKVMWDGFSGELFHKEWVTSAVKLCHTVCAGLSNLPNRITSQTWTSKHISSPKCPPKGRITKVWPPVHSRCQNPKEIRPIWRKGILGTPSLPLHRKWVASSTNVFLPWYAASHQPRSSRTNHPWLKSSKHEPSIHGWNLQNCQPSIHGLKPPKLWAKHPWTKASKTVSQASMDWSFQNYEPTRIFPLLKLTSWGIFLIGMQC